MKAYAVYFKVTAMLLVIAILGVGVTLLTAPKQEDTPASGELQMVASFYPVYITALNLTQGVDGVTLDCLVKEQVGCLHDYQMSPKERQLLESADVLMLNGAGAETALFSTVTEPIERNIQLIDLSTEISLVVTENSHDHNHDHDHEYTENSHLWVSPWRYHDQVKTLRDELCDIDPAHAAQYRANAAAYLTQIDAVCERLERAVGLHDDKARVLFHDSLTYLSEDVFYGTTLNIGENQSADPDTLASVADRLAGIQKALFLYDSQYENVPYTYLQTIPEQATVIAVDTCVKGEAHPDRWLEAMTKLCEDLEATA